jgi:hypothetical protein
VYPNDYPRFRFVIAACAQLRRRFWQRAIHHDAQIRRRGRSAAPGGEPVTGAAPEALAFA